jgi:uncharacterized repeat protein (TIGR03803 family)
MSNRGSNSTYRKSACAVLLFCAAAIASAGQTFTTLLSFDGINGSNPVSPVVQGFDGNLYGTTEGTVFKITPGGTLTKLHSFHGPDGYFAERLTLATDGNFYGITAIGGANNGQGTVFKITAGGKLTTLHSFCFPVNCTDGSHDGYNPNGGLIQATDGNFYGVTYYGGANDGLGTVFKITAGGQLTTLHSFAGQPTEGGGPVGLVQGTDGSFYGATYSGGGIRNPGTVFKITPGGTFTTLQIFHKNQGIEPRGPLVQASDGSFYGTTSRAGASYWGTVFKITAGGALTTLHSFDGSDGATPSQSLIQAIDGNFYGTTLTGGTYNAGTIFKMTPEGILTTLHSFDGADGGESPSGLVEATDGTFYGTTQTGGTGTLCAAGCGTVFRLDVGLGPFVKALPAFGKVGAKVVILGTNLTGTTDVSFNGTTATFNVVSSSEIKTTVPTGATTGKISVTTPGGTLSSDLVFRVRP